MTIDGMKGFRNRFRTWFVCNSGLCDAEMVMRTGVFVLRASQSVTAFHQRLVPRAHQLDAADRIGPVDADRPKVQCVQTWHMALNTP